MQIAFQAVLIFIKKAEILNAILTEKFGILFTEYQLIQAIDDKVFQMRDEAGRHYKFKVLGDASLERRAAILQIGEWVNYLSDALAYPFPRLIKSKTGNAIQKFNAPINGWGILYEWLPFPILENYTNNNMGQLGYLLALVHDKSRTYEGPKNQMKQINGEWIQKEALPKLFSVVQLHWKEASRIARFKRNCQHLSNWLDRQDDVGMIHSDIHRKNIVRLSNTVSLIDFEDALWAPLGLDIGTLFNEFADFPDQYKSLKDSFWKGYLLGGGKELKRKDLLYNRKIADIIYADWIFSDWSEHSLMKSEKAKFGWLALESILFLDSK